MTDLSPETRALLDAARGGLGPDAATVQRMRAGIATKVGGGLLAGSLAAKLGFAALLTAAVVGVFVHEMREDVTAPQLPDMPAPPAPPAPVAGAVVAETVPAPPVVAAEPDLSHIEIETPRRVWRRDVVHADLDREVALIDRASAALASGDTLRAITTIHLYVTETAGRGQLAEEAAAIEVEAMCTADMPAAPKKLAAFRAAFPRSTQAARLITACQD